ncbi:MAG: methionyl-tRNA formyltransferase [Candidatus Omnitrophica bacterium]|nr:methionyl-tRNA formyltransferase [Candidatus Omnitrophota bacterium]
MAFDLWFAGSGAIAAPCLNALAEHHTVLGVLTQPDRPQGRGRELSATPIAEAAKQLKLPALKAASAKDPEILKAIQESHPDILIVFAYGNLLPEALLKIPSRGAINIHPSLLPKYRGAAPIPWAILNGNSEAGITIFQMDAKMDHGPILFQQRLPVQARETTVSLTERVMKESPEILLAALEKLEAGQLKPTPQDDSKATSAPSFKKADGKIEWSAPCCVLDRKVRALNPWPGTFVAWQKQDLKILQAICKDHSKKPDSKNIPGTLLQIDAEGIHVQSIPGVLVLQLLQPAGKRPMSAVDFARGSRLVPGRNFA